MYSTYYIFHIVGIALWIGSFAAFGFLLRSLVNQKEPIETYSFVIKRIRLWVNTGVFPSSFIVMITGVLMILQFDRDTLPFYLQFMEQAGSIIILSTIISLAIYSRKISGKLNGKEMKKEKSLESLTLMYTNFLFGSAALALIVVIITGMRII
ncbi:hypothetical protein [Salipaludibacillus daqingensis]|uniref:hypothetical protein n=1 Tax=Salipaludibacillus daqingensis TaxID=3041001 RepID=UPI002472EA14|nr:hypothetical protein [Salipaludibacillus daqingensis]